MSDAYILDRSPGAAAPVRCRTDLLAEDSRYLARRAGVSRGMRVLDVGCGSGDLALVLADLVGPDGRVVAVDRNPEALGVARERAAVRGVGNVEFRAADVTDAADLADLAGPALDRPVDAVVGRMVLVHLTRPVRTIRDLCRLVRPGGIVTFQEPVLSTTGAVPAMPLLDLTLGRILTAARAEGMDPDVGHRLHDMLRAAGLRAPRIAACQPASGDAATPILDGCADSARSMLPLVEKHGVATAAEMRVADLADLLHAEACAIGAVVYMFTLVAGWARVG